jgi:diguanylate cyclase (GGDEF)-like protein
VPATVFPDTMGRRHNPFAENVYPVEMVEETRVSPWFRLIPPGIIVAGTIFAVVYGWYAFQAERGRVDELFRRNAKDHVKAVETGVLSHLEAVNSLADLFTATGEVSRDEFAAFAGSIRDRIPNVKALEWVPRVHDGNRAELEAQAREDIPWFRFHGGPRRFAGDGAVAEDRFPVYYVEPLEGNEAALGFDPPHHPIRQDAVLRAVNTGEMAVSAPTDLVQGGPLAILVFAPVYAAGADAVPESVVGLAEGVFDVGAIFEQSLAMLEPTGQDLFLVDVTDEPVTVHEHISRRAGTGTIRFHEIAGGQRYEQDFTVGGRLWRFEVLPHEGFYRYDLIPSVGFAMAIVLTCGVLAFGVTGLLKRESLVSRLVAERTAQLSYQATHDGLTGLMNRVEFDRVLRHFLGRATSNDEVATLAYLDLDQFKVVNDTCGHEAGDELLRQVGDVIRSALKRDDVLARLGGDEFGVLLFGCTAQEACGVADRIIEAVQAFRLPWRDRVFSIGVSMGLVQLDGTTAGGTAALSQADAACYVAKERGRGRYHLVRREDGASDQYRRQMEWLSVLRRAIENDAFALWMQPIARVRGELPPTMFEVLLRLPMPDGSMAMPGAFLPAAERFLMMPEIDRWVIQRVVHLLDLGHLAPDNALWCVNISAQTLNDEEFANRTLDLFEASGVSPARICFEITETTLIGNLASAGRHVSRLREAGCRFSLDDFGSGMSSFGYLKNLPVDYVKIDGSYVRGMVEDPADRVIVGAIHEIAETMGIRTIAESVEHRGVLEAVRSVGIDFVQGYHVGRPMDSNGWPEAVGALADLLR